MKKRVFCICACLMTVMTSFGTMSGTVYAEENMSEFYSENAAAEKAVQDREEISVKFMDGSEQSGETFIKTYTDTISESEIPVPKGEEGKDFLGWYWGPGSKYEGNFTLNLSEIPGNVRNSLNGTLVFTARYGNNVPANDIVKPGYRLIFNDEFNGTELDMDNWVDKYLSSWSTTSERTKEWTVKDGAVNIQIKENTQPWCPEFDGETVVTGFTTGQRNALHNWNGNNKVRNTEDAQLTHINQYGYYEMRAKGQSGSSRHSAWWLLGFEDVPEESAEIDIFEVLGNNNHNVPPALHNWNDKDAFSGGVPSFSDRNKDFNNEFHIYGFDWQEGTGEGAYPDKIVFYIDGIESASKNVNIDYPMIQLLSLYEKRAGGWTGNWEWMPYPNSYEVDYIRVYKKLPVGQDVVTEAELRVENVRSEDLELYPDEVVLRTYEGCDGYVEKNLTGTKSYVRVDWNDGVETQEPVFWDPITEEDLNRLNQGERITKNGQVPSVNQSVQMNISVKERPYIPYTMEGMTSVKGSSDLVYVFDGLTNEGTNAGSGEFRATDFSDDKVFFTYDFEKNVNLKGVDIWANYGADQGIRKFKVAAWDEVNQQWNTIQEENVNQDKIFVPLWTTKEEAAEEWSAVFEPIETSKVKIIVLEANYKWGKFSIREIGFQKDDVIP